MTTVAALQADIANILSRDDLDGDFAMHLRLAHARINRDVRCRAMEKVYAFRPSEQGVTADRLTSVDLAAEFSPFTLLAVTTVAYGLLSDPSQMTLVSLEQLLEDADKDTPSGTPTRYALGYNSNGAPIIYLDPGVAADDTSYLTVAGFVAFSLDTTDSTATNWLLTNHYDVYLYSLAAVACGTIQDFDRQRQYLGMYQAAVAELAKVENQARTGGSVIERQGGDNDGYRV